MGNGNKKPDLFDVSCELKMNSKQMERQANKLEGEERAARKKILDCMNKGQMDNAKIHAETVIR